MNTYEFGRTHVWPIWMYSAGVTEKYQNPHRGQPLAPLRFEPDKSGKQVTGVAGTRTWSVIIYTAKIHGNEDEREAVESVKKGTCVPTIQHGAVCRVKSLPYKHVETSCPLKEESTRKVQGLKCRLCREGQSTRSNVCGTRRNKSAAFSVY